MYKQNIRQCYLREFEKMFPSVCVVYSKLILLIDFREFRTAILISLDCTSWKTTNSTKPEHRGTRTTRVHKYRTDRMKNTEAVMQIKGKVRTNFHNLFSLKHLQNRRTEILLGPESYKREGKIDVGNQES